MPSCNPVTQWRLVVLTGGAKMYVPIACQWYKGGEIQYITAYAAKFYELRPFQTREHDGTRQKVESKAKVNVQHKLASVLRKEERRMLAQSEHLPWKWEPPIVVRAGFRICPPLLYYTHTRIQCTHRKNYTHTPWQRSWAWWEPLCVR